MTNCTFCDQPITPFETYGPAHTPTCPSCYRGRESEIDSLVADWKKYYPAVERIRQKIAGGVVDDGQSGVRVYLSKLKTFWVSKT